MAHPAIHRTAAAGNLVMLAICAVVAGSWPLLVEDRSGIAVDDLPVADRSVARRAVLVIIDGLRVDAARTSSLMPVLHSMAERGGRGVARVECLIPSSVAGISTLVTGRVPGPVSFLQDFRARAATHGGLFEQITTGGGRVFVAGPRLWEDRFGAWIHSGAWDDTFGRRDPQLVRQAIAAVQRREHQLVVLHLSAPDAAAHQFGADSAQYTRSVASCDHAVAQLRQVIDPATCLIVTSDHGNIGCGGHAGTEESVTRVPVYALGPGLPEGDLKILSQRDIPRMIAAALGFQLPDPPIDNTQPPATVATLAVLGAGSLALAIATRLAHIRNVVRLAFWLNAAVWINLLLFIAGLPQLALVAVLGVFVLGVLLFDCGAMAAHAAATAAGAALGGICLGGMRLAAAGEPAAIANTSAGLWWLVAMTSGAFIIGRTQPAEKLTAASRAHGFSALMVMVFLAAWLVGDARLGIACLVACCGGHLIARLMQSTTLLPWAALAVAVIQSAAAGLSGQSLSLSTIDVRAGFLVVEWHGGLVLAAMVVVLAQALPTLALLAGVGDSWRALPQRSIGIISASLAAIYVAEACMFGVLLNTASHDIRLAGLALGGLLRTLCESLFLFLGLAAILMAPGPRGAAAARQGVPGPHAIPQQS